jgi:hypothetical protein
VTHQSAHAVCIVAHLQTFPIVALMLRPSVFLAVWLHMYVEAHTGAAPDIGDGGALHACIMYRGCGAPTSAKPKA